MTDDYIERREFERVVTDVERRLAGHDGLYKDLQDTREELVRFTEALVQARGEITSGLTDRDKCRAECFDNRRGFEKRIRALERFRWQIAGALIVIAAVPGWTTLVIVLIG